VDGYISVRHDIWSYWKRPISAKLLTPLASKPDSLLTPRTTLRTGYVRVIVPSGDANLRALVDAGKGDFTVSCVVARANTGMTKPGAALPAYQHDPVHRPALDTPRGWEAASLVLLHLV
jgi:hypothetical protein